MNTASRMESTGSPGAVHCTTDVLAALGDATAEAVGCYFERRSLDVKGLGQTATCLVRAGSAEAAALLDALPQPRTSSARLSWHSILGGLGGDDGQVAILPSASRGRLADGGDEGGR